MTLRRRWCAVVVLAFVSTFLSQGQQAAAPIYLKSRTIDPSAPAMFASLSLQQAPQDRQRVLVQFQDGIQPELLMRLRNRGVRVLSYVPLNALIVSAPLEESFDGLGVTYRAALEAWDKVPDKLLGDTAAWRTPVALVFEFYEDVNSEDARGTLLLAGATLRQHPDLRPWQVLADASPQLAYQLAGDPRLAYVFPASQALLSGAPATACRSGWTSADGIAAALAAGQGDGWDGSGKGSATLTYSLGALTDRLDASLTQGEIERALAEWVNHVQIHLRRTTDRNAERNVDILFAAGAHGDAYPFDGRSGSLAHTFYPSPPNAEPRAGDLHLDADELWGGGTDLYSVVLHELGHAFGLGHSTDPEAVMYPYYRRAGSLTADDIASIQTLYASGPGSLDTSTGGAIETGPLTLTVDNPPSRVSTETVSLQGAVTGGQGSVTVSWFILSGGTALGTAQRSSGTSWTASAIPLSPGVNQILIGALDEGNAQVSQLVTVERVQDGSGNPSPPPASQPPAVTVTDPASTFVNTTAATIRIRGTASHSAGISTVLWRNPATAKSGTATGTTSWDTGLLDLASGVNLVTIEVRSTDGVSATRDIAVTRTEAQQPSNPDPPATNPPTTNPPTTDPPPANPPPTSGSGSGDTTAPTLRVTSPSSATVTTTAATIVVAGTATDNSGVTSVTWATAQNSGTAAGTANWTATVPLLVGMNNIVVRAYDAAGNSSWRSINVTRRAN